MKTAPIAAPCYEFYFAPLDTLVTVENLPRGPVIRASRHTFSTERKACFIRELAAEGFIADKYRWDHAGALEEVQWIVDRSAFMPDAAHVAQTRRFILRLVCSAAVLWLILMTGLILGWTR
jgi:hypothetical protein